MTMDEITRGKTVQFLPVFAIDHLFLSLVFAYNFGLLYTLSFWLYIYVHRILSQKSQTHKVGSVEIRLCFDSNSVFIMLMNVYNIPKISSNPRTSP